MSGQARLREGMEVYGADERLIGRVERVYGGGFEVAGFHYGRDTVVRIEQDRAYIQGVGEREAVAGGGTAAAGGIGAGETAELSAEGEIRVPVVEEQLQVGTREVELGEVEIHRRVVEEEQTVPVTLRREEVTVRQVDTPDRPLQPGEDVFSEETIRVAVRGEEAVVAKEAVVTGELVVNKDVTQEERQVSDTVRRTEIDFDETYTRARADFEAHHASAVGTRGGAFADYERHYQSGFRAGGDTRYAGRSFDEVESDLRREHESGGAGSLWDEIRERVRTGFERARK